MNDNDTNPRRVHVTSMAAVWARVVAKAERRWRRSW